MVIGLLFNFVIMNGRLRGVMVVSVYVEEGERAGCLAVNHFLARLSTSIGY